MSGDSTVQPTYMGLCEGGVIVRSLSCDLTMEAMALRCGISPSAPGSAVLGSNVQWLRIPGWLSAQGDPSPSSPFSAPTPGWLPENPGVAQDQPSAERTQVLASQASRFLAQVSGTPPLPGDMRHLEKTEPLPANLIMSKT